MSAHVIETVRNLQPMACVAYQYYSNNEQYSALDMLRIELLIGELNGVYIFLDGLDETCDADTYWRETKQVLAALCQMSSSNPAKVRLWISSQDRAPIRKLLYGYSCVDMTEENTAFDINTFFNDSSYLEDLSIEPESRSLIVKELNDRAKGNFLYAYLMADALQHAENLKDLETQIQENLPRKLDDYYHHILARIDKR
jgi:hypothetical protein